MWALMILLVGDVSGLPRVSWHASEAACIQQAQIELFHLAVTDRAVESVACQPYRVTPLRPVRPEVLR